MPYSRHVTGGVDHLWNVDAHGYAVIRSCGAIGKRGTVPHVMSLVVSIICGTRMYAGLADAHGYAVIRSCGAIGERGCTSSLVVWITCGTRMYADLADGRGLIYVLVICS